VGGPRLLLAALSRVLPRRSWKAFLGGLIHEYDIAAAA
jgi:hypothetical protein